LTLPEWGGVTLSTGGGGGGENIIESVDTISKNYLFWACFSHIQLYLIKNWFKLNGERSQRKIEDIERLKVKKSICPQPLVRPRAG